MRKHMTGAEKRYWVEKLLDEYGADVWSTLSNHYEAVEVAEDAFVYVFTMAIKRFEKHRKEGISETWFRALAQEAMQANQLPQISHEIDLIDVTETALLSDATSQEHPEDELTGANVGGVNVTPVPPRLYRQTVHMMRATIATEEAMRHHRGPLWIKVGAVAVVVVGISGIGYGASGEVLTRFHHTAPKVTSSSELNVVPVAGNLPVTPVSVYQLSQAETSMDLSHFVVATNEIYQSTLVQSADSWPEIHVDGYELGTGTTQFQAAKEQNFVIELVPPLQQSHASANSNSNWNIVNWSLSRMSDRWLVAVVRWSDGNSSDANTTQIYALNVQNSNYSLVDTLRPQSGVANQFAVASGDGKIAIQPALNDGTGTAPLGLPIEVYTLTGTDAFHAWTQTSQIPASFGVMTSPIATTNGLLFQGIVGKSPSASTNSSLWYQMSWTGQLSQLQGPPIDGQSHWATRGQSGTLWWVETTPVAKNGGSGYQVSMGKLAASASASSVKNLDSPVLELSVSGDYLLWIENQAGTKPQLVVAQVQ